MKRKNWFLVLTMISMSVVYNPAFSQEGESIKKQQKRLDKKKEERAEGNEKAKQEGIDRHMDNQDKETRKRMKKNKKKANRINSGKKEPFYKRWFIKK
jgi:Flp pilus assembly protein TadB